MQSSKFNSPLLYQPDRSFDRSYDCCSVSHPLLVKETFDHFRYRELGYPFGKSIRGLKKFAKKHRFFPVFVGGSYHEGYVSSQPHYMLSGYKPNGLHAQILRSEVSMPHDLPEEDEVTLYQGGSSYHGGLDENGELYMAEGDPPGTVWVKTPQTR